MTISRAFACGLGRGRLEITHLLRTPREVVSQLSTPFAFVVLAMVNNDAIPGSALPMADVFIAGGVAAVVVQTCLIALPQMLATEREEGTLLRQRTAPEGMTAYLVGKTCLLLAQALIGIALVLAGGAVFAGSDLPAGLGDWLTLLWVLPLGLLAMAPIGAALGAVLPNAREALAWSMMPVLGVMAISGIFFSITSLPEAVQTISQLFPPKWIAQGVRSALLPDSALAAETGHSWQHLQTLGVTAAWAVAGFALAPRVLRRMTRRESGSRLAERRAAAPA